MSTVSYNPVASLEEIRQSWGWFLFLGIALTILGIVSIIFDVTITFTTAVIFGIFLLIGGVLEFVHSLWTGMWNGFFLYFLSGLLRGVTGYLLLAYPRIGAESLTLLLGSYFMVGGLFRAIGSGMAKIPRWGWTVFAGIVSVVLGIIVLWRMPITGVWFIGLAVGLDFIFDGIAACSFASAMHQQNQETILQGA